eukprot:CAMPEP_0206281404 /NCGR_PEP_ID=MMETSP0047_2-20121206/39110_1 /ASSEMBLY_ACC=CAM_ASM_000192 /TAXON_ID=195065 /ORGANISM="Chroomonas mesostigmatica_cf, Strain CCMP1168" /LENGTH=189 /DNA_ID=CAMNT_0053711563 /DNA_START=38 /DNA_END=604 /DNA_ORIENTATION=+
MSRAVGDHRVFCPELLGERPQSTSQGVREEGGVFCPELSSDGKKASRDVSDQSHRATSPLGCAASLDQYTILHRRFVASSPVVRAVVGPKHFESEERLDLRHDFVAFPDNERMSQRFREVCGLVASFVDFSKESPEIREERAVGREAQYLSFSVALSDLEASPTLLAACRSVGQRLFPQKFGINKAPSG